MPTEPESARIEPRLSVFDTSMVVVSLVIGIGIFRTPSIVAAACGTTGRFFAAWALGGLVSLIGALTFAEIGSRYPRAGGYYKVVADCYHPALAFMLNWAQALMQGAGAAGVAFIGAEYLGLVVLTPAQRGPRAVLAVASGLMLVLLALNFLGIRSGARTQNVLSLVKIGMILALALTGLRLPAASAPAAGPPAAPFSLWGFVAAAVPVFYAYGGYQNAMNLAADVRRPRRGLPLAITWGMAIVTGLYLLVNFAYERVLGIDGVAGASLVAAAVARAAFGERGENLVAVAIFLSAAGFVNATILQVPRSYYAMAEDGALPSSFRRVNPRTQAQEAGLLFFGATMLLPALLLGSFEKLVDYVMFTDALTIATVASTLFVLRRRGVGDGEAYRMPGYPWLPAVFLACLLGIALRVLVGQPKIALAGTAIFVLGGPLFYLARKGSARGSYQPISAQGPGRR